MVPYGSYSSVEGKQLLSENRDKQDECTIHHNRYRGLPFAFKGSTVETECLIDLNCAKDVSCRYLALPPLKISLLQPLCVKEDCKREKT